MFITNTVVAKSSGQPDLTVSGLQGQQLHRSVEAVGDTMFTQASKVVVFAVTVFMLTSGAAGTALASTQAVQEQTTGRMTHTLPIQNESAQDEQNESKPRPTCG